MSPFHYFVYFFVALGCNTISGILVQTIIARFLKDEKFSIFYGNVLRNVFIVALVIDIIQTIGLMTYKGFTP